MVKKKESATCIFVLEKSFLPWPSKTYGGIDRAFAKLQRSSIMPWSITCSWDVETAIKMVPQWQPSKSLEKNFKSEVYWRSTGTCIYIYIHIIIWYIYIYTVYIYIVRCIHIKIFWSTKGRNLVQCQETHPSASWRSPNPTCGWVKICLKCGWHMVKIYGIYG